MSKKIVLLSLVAATVSLCACGSPKIKEEDALQEISDAIRISYFTEPMSNFQYSVETRWSDHCDDKDFEGIMEINPENRTFETSGKFTALNEIGEFSYGWEYYIDYGEAFVKESSLDGDNIFYTVNSKDDPTGHDYDEVEEILMDIFDSGGDYRTLAITQLLPKHLCHQLTDFSDNKMASFLDELFSKDNLITIWGYNKQEKNDATIYSFDVDFKVLTEFLGKYEVPGFMDEGRFQQEIEIDGNGYVTRIVVGNEYCIYSARFRDYQIINSIQPDWAR